MKRRANGLFVTGTDTGCGKTAITLALIAHYQSLGLQVAGMKPVASGADETDAGLRNEDAVRIQQAASVELPYEVINPYCFSPPIAPHIAAAEAGVEIDLEVIRRAYMQLAESADLVIVEGVGGMLVPLNGRHDLGDLMRHLDLPILLVVGLKLGCINHALLSAETLQRRQLPLHGWIANQIDGGMLRMEENLASLQSRINFPFIGHVPKIAGKNTNRPISGFFRDFSLPAIAPIL